MGIFPQNDVEAEYNFIESNEELPVFREYAIDFKTGSFLYTEDGKNIILEKDEALKVWIWKAIQVKKNKYTVYSDEYGQEFEELYMNKSYSKDLIDTEMQRLIEECLLINPYIKSIDELESEFDESKLTINLKVKTIYGEVKLDV